MPACSKGLGSGCASASNSWSRLLWRPGWAGRSTAGWGPAPGERSSCSFPGSAPACAPAAARSPGSRRRSATGGWTRAAPPPNRPRTSGTRTRNSVAIKLQPLEQFSIERIVPLHIGKLDISYTNSALMMTIAVVLITALVFLSTRRAALVPGRWQSVTEMLYEFVADMLDPNAGHGAEPFFPFVFTLFVFILFCNLL